MSYYENGVEYVGSEIEMRASALRLIDKNRKKAFSDDFSRTITFEMDEDAESENAKLLKNYAMSFDKNSKGLWLYGDCGTGKSFYATCICNKVIDRGFTAHFTNLSEISVRLWDAPEGKTAIFDELRNYDLLVLDDFATERRTEYMSEIVYNVIETRYRSRKPMIITTNLTAAELNNPKSVFEKRIFSRIAEMAIPLKFEGNDKRKEILKNSYKSELEKLNNFEPQTEDEMIIQSRVGISRHRPFRDF